MNHIHTPDHETHTQHSTSWTLSDPTERGEAYVVVMRDLAEFAHEPALHTHYANELAAHIRPLARMSAADLNLFLEGAHAAFCDTLDDLIAARNRAQLSAQRAQRVDPTGSVR